MKRLPSKTRFDPIPFLTALEEIIYCASNNAPHSKSGIENEIFETLPSGKRRRCPCKWELKTDGKWKQGGCEVILTTWQNLWTAAAQDLKGDRVLAAILAQKGYTVTYLKVRRPTWHNRVEARLSFRLTPSKK